MIVSVNNASDYNKIKWIHVDYKERWKIIIDNMWEAVDKMTTITDEKIV